MENQFILEMKNISKSFSGVQVLYHVDLQIKAGEIRALVGENGAGKSTLMKVLGGILQKDTGEILIQGEKKSIDSVNDAKENGIALIHQEISLVQALSIAENIFLGREPMGRNGLVDLKKIHRDTKEIMAKMGLQLDSHTLVKDLSISQQQMVEICRALASQAKIIVMDEPTASLTDKEIRYLFEQIRKLQQEKVAIIYISHKMDEIFEISDSISVLRDGKHVVTVQTKETEYKEVIRHMVGRDLDSFYAKRIEKAGEKILEIKEQIGRASCRERV